MFRKPTKPSFEGAGKAKTAVAGFTLQQSVEGTTVRLRRSPFTHSTRLKATPSGSGALHRPSAAAVQAEGAIGEPPEMVAPAPVKASAPSARRSRSGLVRRCVPAPSANVVAVEPVSVAR